MGIMDGINIAEGAMSVHSYRSQIAAENLSNLYTPGYRRQEVQLGYRDFGTALDEAAAGRPSTVGAAAGGGMDANTGAVQVRGVRKVKTGPDSVRQDQLRASVDMMEAKNAFNLAVRAATLLKSMATTSLEIGRGS